MLSAGDFALSPLDLLSFPKERQICEQYYTKKEDKFPQTEQIMKILEISAEFKCLYI